MLALHKNDVFANRFLLTDQIGARGVSEVWVCEDLLEKNEEVAIKIYTPLDRTDQYFLEQLKEDIAADQSVQHPHLLQIYDFDVFNSSPYIVMPYITQGSLKSKLHDTGPLTEFEAAVLLKQIGSALHKLHSTTHLHQNIKSENILIAGKDDYVLADSSIHNRIKTALPRIAGHPESNSTAYAPPELFTVRPTAYTASDIFSFGVTLYEICAGQLPWMGNGGISLLQGAAVPYLPVSYSRELNKILIACMDPKWEKRPTAEELMQEGNYFIDNGRWKPYGRFSVAKVDVVKYEKRSSLKIALWATAIFVALSALGFLLYTQTDIVDNVIKPIAETPDSEAMTASETTENEGSEAQATTAPEPTVEQQTPATPDARPIAQEPARQDAPKEAVITKTPERKQAVKPVRKPEAKRPAYPKPTTAEHYLAQIQNKDIPRNVREQWRQDVWRFFDRSASVNYVAGGELVGILSADELVDMMLDQANPTFIRVDSTKKNAAGKVDQVFVHVQE